VDGCAYALLRELGLFLAPTSGWIVWAVPDKVVLGCLFVFGLVGLFSESETCFLGHLGLTQQQIHGPSRFAGFCVGSLRGSVPGILRVRLRASMRLSGISLGGGVLHTASGVVSRASAVLPGASGEGSPVPSPNFPSFSAFCGYSGVVAQGFW
jgi:hypothetical protein